MAPGLISVRSRSGEPAGMGTPTPADATTNRHSEILAGRTLASTRLAKDIRWSNVPADIVPRFLTRARASACTSSGSSAGTSAS